MLQVGVLLMTCLFSLVGISMGSQAQPPPKTPQIAVLRPGSPPDRFVDAFRRGMQELGYVEGRNVTISYRWADGRADRLPILAAELIHLKPDVVVAAGNEVVRAVKQATTTIPIVMPVSTDPVRLGLVASLARPGGNLTGFASQNDELPGKWIEFLKEIIPGASRVAALWDPASAEEQLTAARRAAQAVRLQLQVVSAASADDLATAFTEAEKSRAEGLVVLASPFFFAHRSRIVALATRYRLPAIYHERVFVVDAGGLLSYGVDVEDLFRRSAGSVDKILKGAKPQDLPIEQPTKFELAINLRVARNLKLTIPQSLRLRADHVIE